MSLLDTAGIYVLVDLSNPISHINRDAPTWDLDLYASYTSIIDTMAVYANTLGFFAGNSTPYIATFPNTAASAFIKAIVRDMKAYIKGRGYRSIGVRYSTNKTGIVESSYYNCGDNASLVDFYGLNNLS